MPAYDLNGKVALVTGAAQGIGYETARQLHMRGASVAVLDLDAGETHEAAERIGERAIGIGADVTDYGAMQVAVAQTVERFGGLDVAMANAGIFPSSPTTMRTFPSEEWKRIIDVNVLGVSHTLRATLPEVSKRQGHIAIVASIAAFNNGAMITPYVASKAAVEQIGRALRVELAPFGASVGIVYPAFIDTQMAKEGLSQPGFGWIQSYFPPFVTKRVSPKEAGATVVRGIEKRAVKTFVPGWWRFASALRGLTNPILDRRLARDRRVGKVIRDTEGETRA